MGAPACHSAPCCAHLLCLSDTFMTVRNLLCPCAYSSFMRLDAVSQSPDVHPRVLLSQGLTRLSNTEMHP